MNEDWRLIDLWVADCYTQMATDEAIAEACGKGLSPSTIRLYRWNPSAVSLGYFQSLEDEVDTEACRRLGVDIIRRVSGGGAVFHDYNGEITYSLITPEDDPKIPRDIDQSYAVICKGIVRALDSLGLQAEFKPINDIAVSGRKISGNAQTRRYGAVLQHGTVLVDFDPKTMFTVLKVSQEKISDKLIKQVEERVTTIRRELRSQTSFDQVRDALVSGFEDALSVHLLPGSITSHEAELVKRHRAKYSSPEWTGRR